MHQPIRTRTLLIWMAASILFVFVFAIRDRSAAWTFGTGPADVRRALPEAAVVSAFAALCLWQQLRKLFLTPTSQWPTFVFLWALFAVGYPLIGGAIMVIRDDVSVVGPFSREVDWGLSARAIAAGQLAFLGAVFASLIWSIDEPGLAPVRLNREVARGLLARAVAGDVTLSSFSKAQLDQALQALREGSLTLAARVAHPVDSRTLERWAASAGALHAALHPLDVEDYRSFDWSRVESAIADLNKARDR